MKMRIFAIFLAMASLLTMILGIKVYYRQIDNNHAFTTPPAPRTFPHKFIGIVSYDVAKFDQTCRCAPNVAVHYLPMGGSTGMSIVQSIIANGAIPMLELEPYNISLTKIISGSEDAWLTQYAHAVSSLHSPVIMSFAPEANGNWYSWGYPYVAPSVVVSAWRHVVTVFRRAGVQDVKWAWIMNVQFPGSENIALLWPGGAFVNLLGIDGYLINSATFQSTFGPTIVAMRSISSDPLLITETAAAPSIGKATALAEITDGVAQYGLTGFIWFDISQQGGPERQDWSLEDDPAALDLFSTDVKRIR